MRHNQEQQKWIPEVSLSPSMARFLPYRGQYVAVQGERLIAHPKLAEVLREAKASGKPFTIHAIPKALGKLRILPIRIRSLGFHASDESQVAHVSPLRESPKQAHRGTCRPPLVFSPKVGGRPRGGRYEHINILSMHQVLT